MRGVRLAELSALYQRNVEVAACQMRERTVLGGISDFATSPCLESRMDILPPDIAHQHSLETHTSAEEAFAARWLAVHDAAAVVARLAGMSAGLPHVAVQSFPEAISQADPVRQSIAEQGLEDIFALMEPGLETLLTVYRRGNDPAAPAAALWLEFQRTRNSLLALTPATALHRS